MQDCWVHHSIMEYLGPVLQCSRRDLQTEFSSHVSRWELWGESREEVGQQGCTPYVYMILRDCLSFSLRFHNADKDVGSFSVLRATQGQIESDRPCFCFSRREALWVSWYCTSSAPLVLGFDLKGFVSYSRLPSCSASQLDLILL